MNTDTFGRIIDELKPYLFNINLWFQGEPMLNPDFFAFPGMARGIGMTLSTNGHFITDETAGKLVTSGLRKVIIPLDGMDRDTYGKYRIGGDFEKVTDGIRKLSEAKREHRSGIKLEIQFLVNMYNFHHIERARKFAQDNGYRFRLKSMQVISGEYGYWLPPHKGFKKFRRYRERSNGYVRKGSMRNSCFRLWKNPVITWDGEVLPCCFDKSAEYSFGNLREATFSSIWRGEKSMLFRSRLLSQRTSIKICSNCTTGLRNVRV